jgi:phenylalanyl-tRNA synthetase alpha chain
MAGFDSNEYSGFAFGMGPDRIAMLKYGIEDPSCMFTYVTAFTFTFET